MATVALNTDKFVNISGASEIIGCTESYVRRLLREDVISGIKLGPRVWIVEKKSAEKYAKTSHSRGRPRGSKNG